MPKPDLQIKPNNNNTEIKKYNANTNNNRVSEYTDTGTGSAQKVVEELDLSNSSTNNNASTPVVKPSQSNTTNNNASTPAEIVKPGQVNAANNINNTYTGATAYTDSGTGSPTIVKPSQQKNNASDNGSYSRTRNNVLEYTDSGSDPSAEFQRTYKSLVSDLSKTKVVTKPNQVTKGANDNGRGRNINGTYEYTDSNSDSRSTSRKTYTELVNEMGTSKKKSSLDSNYDALLGKILAGDGLSEEDITKLGLYDYSGATRISKPLNEYLSSEEMGEINDAIEEAVDKAGYGTKEATAAALLTLSYELKKRDLVLPYYYGGGHYGDTSSGVNEDWGDTVSANGVSTMREKDALDCSGAVGWAIRTAGVNETALASTASGYVYGSSATSFDDVGVGDCIGNNDHVVMVVSKYEDESGKEHLLCVEATGSGATSADYDSVNYSSSRLVDNAGGLLMTDWTEDKIANKGYRIVDMDSYYENQGWETGEKASPDKSTSDNSQPRGNSLNVVAETDSNTSKNNNSSIVGSNTPKKNKASGSVELGGKSTDTGNSTFNSNYNSNQSNSNQDVVGGTLDGNNSSDVSRNTTSNTTDAGTGRSSTSQANDSYDSKYTPLFDKITSGDKISVDDLERLNLIDSSTGEKITKPLSEYLSSDELDAINNVVKSVVNGSRQQISVALVTLTIELAKKGLMLF